MRGDGNFPSQLIKTDVQIEDISFQEKYKQTSTASSEDGDKLIKSEKLKINGRDAHRFWFTGGDTDILITLVKYTSNKTAYLASFYTPDNSKAIPIVQKMHNTFKVLK